MGAMGTINVDFKFKQNSFRIGFDALHDTTSCRIAVMKNGGHPHDIVFGIVRRHREDQPSAIVGRHESFCRAAGDLGNLKLAEAALEAYILFEAAALGAKLTTPDMWWDAEDPGHTSLDDPQLLADSMNMGGVFQCLAARQLPDVYYEVISGHDNDGEPSDNFVDVREITREEYDRVRAEAAREVSDG